MTEQQIKDYLQKYKITSEELLANHIEQLKRNTVVNNELIFPLVEMMLNNKSVLLSFFREIKKEETAPFFLDEVVGAHNSTIHKSREGETHMVFKTIDLNTIFSCRDSAESTKCNKDNCYFYNTSLLDFLSTNPQYFPKDKQPYFETILDEQLKECLGNSFGDSKIEKDLVFPPESEIHKDDGIKETENKICYEELDWDYIDSMALRMSKNLEKYPPKNWQKRMDIKKLAEASIRHARKIIQEIDNDEETLTDHAIALGANGMMINYQLKNNE